MSFFFIDNLLVVAPQNAQRSTAFPPLPRCLRVGIAGAVQAGYPWPMAKADRLERLDTRRAELEAEYTAALIAALKVTAAGKWGLFDHQANRAARTAIAPVIANLAEVAEAIDDAREQLAMPPFELHREFLAARGPVDAHAVGEPKQARAWLDRLAANAPS